MAGGSASSPSRTRVIVVPSAARLDLYRVAGLCDMPMSSEQLQSSSPPSTNDALFAGTSWVTTSSAVPAGRGVTP